MEARKSRTRARASCPAPQHRFARDAAPVPGLRRRRSQGMLNERLLRAIGEVSAGQPSMHFVQCSSSLPTGAIILHGFVKNESTARVVVKTARNPDLPHSL